MDNKRSVRRKNKKIKFSEEKYVENYYMRNDKAIIPLELEKADDLFMIHDYKKMELSDSVCSYIEEIAYMFPINTDIVIEIHCPKIDMFTQSKMRRAIKNNYGIEIDDIDYEIMVQNRRSLILFLIGIFLLVINIMTEKYLGAVLSNFLNIVWWVAIWDMIEIQTIEKSDNKWKRLNYQQLYEADVDFVFDEGDVIGEKE